MTPTYFGYIMKVTWECKKGHDVRRGCVMFKAKGTLSWNVPDPTTQAAPVTTTLPTTTKPRTTVVSTTVVTTTLKATTEEKLTTQVKSTTRVRLKARKPSTTTSLSSTLGSPSTVPKTMSSTKVPTSKRTSQATNSPSPMSQRTSYSTSHVKTESSTESVAPTTEALPTESTVGDVTTIEPTYHSVGSKEPNKDKNKLSGDKEKEDSMMVAIVAGVAAVICVAIALLCMWLIISQRRKHRNGANFGPGTTVISNPTTLSSQNHFPMPGLLKNPVYDDSVYAEPEDKVHKSAVGLLGNPSYETCDNLLLSNPGAKDSQSLLLNNIQRKPLNTAKRVPHANENTYDCADLGSNHGGKPDGEKSVYQSLVKEDALARYKPDANVATYQSLNPEGMYQPLLKNMAPKRQDEIPEYLVLVNPSDSTGNISPRCPEYQPPYSTGPPPADVDESPEYADYADLDELEEISANEASNRTSDQGPCYSAPLYNVLEGPGYEYASAPMYAGPYSVGNTNLGFEQPTYAVLEGPDTN